MTCPSPVVCSLYADGALAPGDAAALTTHLASCAACTALVAALTQESALLRAVFHEADEAVAVPKLHRSLSAADLLVFGAGAAATAWFASGFWGATAALVPRELHWLNPFQSGEGLNLLISLVFYLSREGLPMIATTITSMSVAVLTAMLAGGAFAMLRNRAGTAAVLSVLALLIVLPSLGHATQIRRSEGLTTVAADETIEDTVMLFGESVSVEGNVDGDVIAFGRSITVRGNVTGDLLAFAETVTIEGGIGGNVFGFGRSVEVTRAVVNRNVYGFGRDVTIGGGSQVGGNATLFGSSNAVRGQVGLDLLSFSKDLELSGEVLRNVDVHAARVNVLAPARIGGNFTTHIGDADNVQTAPGATIVGATDTQVSERPDERNRYLTASFYVRQAAWLGAAFVAGLALLWLFPTLRNVSLASGSEALKAGGVGLIAMISVPVAAVIACVTIIGIPLGVVALAAWLLGLYFAKIVLAVFVGRLLFTSPAGVPHHAALLITGLVLILIAINLPYVGFVLNLVFTIVGLGMLINHYLRSSRWREAY